MKKLTDIIDNGKTMIIEHHRFTIYYPGYPNFCMPEKMM